MTKEKIEARLSSLRAEYDQTMTNLQALHGAVQDCQYWLSEIDKEKEDGSN